MVSIPKVVLGYEHLAVEAVPELDAILMARLVRAHELLTVLDVVGHDAVSRVEVVVDRRTPGAAWHHRGCLGLEVGHELSGRDLLHRGLLIGRGGQHGEEVKVAEGLGIQEEVCRGRLGIE